MGYALQTSVALDEPEVPDLHDFIIYDHEGIVALNKPAGLVSMGGAKGEFSIATGLESLATDEWPDKLRLAHRLDRFTSGVILLARSRTIAKNLQTAFQNRAIQKEYWALIDGRPEAFEGEIDAPITEVDLFMGIGEDGKAARTSYNTLQTSDSDVSWVSLKPHTGRRHQLRVHTAHVLGTPILGDQDYHPVYHQRTRIAPSRDFAASGLPEDLNSRMQGQMLHAHSISFMHPMTGEDVTIKAPLPEDRARIWGDLGFDQRAFA